MRCKLSLAMAETLELSITPRGMLRVVTGAGSTAPVPPALRRAFDRGLGEGLLHLAGPLLRADLSPTLAFGRALGRAYYEALCRESALVEGRPPPWPEGATERLLLSVPPMLGAEYAGRATLDDAWQRLHRAAVEAVAEHGALGAWLERQNSAWHGIGRVHFHLAENKRDPDHPFAFVATYVGEGTPRALVHLRSGGSPAMRARRRSRARTRPRAGVSKPA